MLCLQNLCFPLSFDSRTHVLLWKAVCRWITVVNVHPVLGDIKYGNHKMNERTGLKTQALCAQRLTFGRISEENTLQYLSGRVIKLNDPEIVKTYERLTAEK